MTRLAGHILLCRTSTHDRLSVSDALSFCAERRHTHRLCHCSGSVNMVFELGETTEVSNGDKFLQSDNECLWAQFDLKHLSADIRSNPRYAEAVATFGQRHVHLHLVKDSNARFASTRQRNNLLAIRSDCRTRS